MSCIDCMHSVGSFVAACGAFLKKRHFVILSCAAVFFAVAVIERHSGRSLLGPDGCFGWWDGDVWSSENSQRVADAYSFSHIIHGMLFYGFLWLVARRLPLKHRFLIALIIEAGWELLENSPLIVERADACASGPIHQGLAVSGALVHGWRSYQIAGVGRHPMRVLAFPFHIAPDRIRHRLADRPARH